MMFLPSTPMERRVMGLPICAAEGVDISLAGRPNQSLPYQGWCTLCIVRHIGVVHTLAEKSHFYTVFDLLLYA